MSKIKVYTLPNCGYCKQLKKHLDKNNIEYEEIVVTESADAKKFMKDRGYTGVPVTVIGTEEIQGLNIEKIDSLVK